MADQPTAAGLREMLSEHECSTGFHSACKDRKQLNWCPRCIAVASLERIAKLRTVVDALEYGLAGMGKCPECDYANGDHEDKCPLGKALAALHPKGDPADG